MDPELLRRTAEIAGEYVTSLSERPVGASASLDELRAALRVTLEDSSRPALQVIEELVAAADPGLVGTQSPRYFGFVMTTTRSANRPVGMTPGDRAPRRV